MKEMLNEHLISLSLKSTNKIDCIKELALLLKQENAIDNIEEYVADVLKREEQVSTELEDGLAMPHAKSSSVLKPAVAIGISKEGIVFGENKSYLIFLIAMPANAVNEHVNVLADITGKLIEDGVIPNLINANSTSEIIDLLTQESVSLNNVGNKGFLIGVTGCPVGVAHTYLAAKSLVKEAINMGYEIKVETNGSIGVENSPTKEEIEKAKAIIIASDKQVELDRFAGKKVVFAGVKEGIDNPKGLIEAGLSDATPVYQSDSKNGVSSKNTKTKGKSQFYTALMNGVSFMVPFVVIGGLLIAISLAIGGKPTPAGLVIPEGSFWNQILNIGSVGFTLMIPILAGYIAYAIGDRPALAPGMIGGWIANNGSFYGAEAGTGFIGAIIAGFLVGYFIKYLKKFKVSDAIQPLMPIMILPVSGTLFIGLVFIFLIGQGQYEFMGAQAMAIPVAPLGMALATFLSKKMGLYDDEEVANGKAALAMGLVGISEGAIPFAAADPLVVIPANMIGSAVACTLGFMFEITNTVAHGGPIVLLLGVVNHPFIGLGCMLAGTIVTALITILLKKLKSHKIA
ncbi:hypothetical protein AN396_00005 [Candidatus Epulonipiscium fishelsonii]|uniref:Uncharacterized protein n=1 Tax=Candidatus Epulonipiscium fishelsonii TaxID=77094 RepID=A0ACC8XGV3_9FIRM|nr:hypothetical protein AN396_00005 [Epulopiscium sp. SCG-B11WGA-EpuloA1]